METIVPYTIEEAYEVADAIHHGDLEALREELGAEQVNTRTINLEEMFIEVAGGAP